MAAKRPSFQFYSADWLKDPAVRAVSLAARGLWFDMLCLMDQAPSRGFLQLSSGQPLSHDQLARMTGCSPEEASRLLQELEIAGVFSARRGTIYSRRMVRDEEIRQRNSANGLKGGNPSLKPPVKPPDNHTPEEEDEVVSAIDFVKCSEELYSLYPIKVGRRAALRAIQAALRKVGADVLREAVTAYAQARKGEDQQFTPHPATWFNQERWTDDRSTWRSSQNSKPATNNPARSGGDFSGDFAEVRQRAEETSGGVI